MKTGKAITILDLSNEQKKEFDLIMDKINQKCNIIRDDEFLSIIEKKRKMVDDCKFEMEQLGNL